MSSRRGSAPSPHRRPLNALQPVLMLSPSEFGVSSLSAAFPASPGTCSPTLVKLHSVPEIANGNRTHLHGAGFEASFESLLVIRSTSCSRHTFHDLVLSRDLVQSHRCLRAVYLVRQLDNASKAIAKTHAPDYNGESCWHLIDQDTPTPCYQTSADIRRP